MEPVTGAIVAGVIFFFLIPLGYFVLPMLFGVIGAAIADEGGAAIGAIVGYLAATAWAIFAVVQVILQIVRLVELLT